MASLRSGSTQTAPTNRGGAPSATSSTSSSTSSTTSSSSSSHKTTTKPSSSPSTEAEDEFLIAADLTLYANPLRCLQRKKNSNNNAKSSSSTNTTNKQESGSTTTRTQANTKGMCDQSQRYDNDANTMIAADLVKYGSPLDG